MSKNRIQRIEVNFPVPIDLPPGWDKTLDALVDMICEQYEIDNPTRTMWPAGHGDKILWNEPHEPGFDSRVYAIDVAERQAHDKEIARRERKRELAKREEGGE